MALVGFAINGGLAGIYVHCDYIIGLLNA